MLCNFQETNTRIICSFSMESTFSVPMFFSPSFSTLPCMKTYFCNSQLRMFIAHMYMCACVSGHTSYTHFYIIYIHSSLTYSKKLTWFCCFFLAYWFYTSYNLLFHPCLNFIRNQFLLKRSASQVGQCMWFQSVATDSAKPTAGQNRAASGIKYLCPPSFHPKKRRKNK